MSTITKEWLQQTIAEYEANRDELPFGLDTNSSIELQAFKLALASLEAEAVGYFYAEKPGDWYQISDGDRVPSHRRIPLYAAPPAPVAVPECFKRLLHHAYGMTMGHDWNKGTMAGHHRAKLCQAVDECRAAMLHGAEPVTTANKSPDDFDFDRFNDVVWLEAVASNPHMHSLTTSTIAMVALELNKRLNVANSPMIPDGWVVCSERMPEETGDIIVVSDGIVMSGISYSRKKGFYLQALEYDADETVDDVTHWMPLPAAPQQEA
ncbi:DUF551 domain-containing protein [Enterobacter hormaechei]|uniref:DUF551 domain-containing protein n=1 Tax=Enterobacter hormaechei TaxID=158836 RepID=UPI0015EABFD4|nr:DUF551 domain-containing protein [Enterobacter hormaechei]QLU81249.1 DUF551 domain-containing protein [Enterobacter hormaechei]HCT8091784.1 DUF551 domain-containing protein [Enterobacter hormaechei]